MNQERIFKNRAEALRELKFRRGCKLGKSQFYADCTRGLCQVQEDGSISEKDLDLYVKFKFGHKHKKEQAVLARTKSELEIKRLREDCRLKELERISKEGGLIPRVIAQQEQASLAALLVAVFRQVITMFVHDRKQRNMLLEETKRVFNDAVTQNREYCIIWRSADDENVATSSASSPR